MAFQSSAFQSSGFQSASSGANTFEFIASGGGSSGGSASISIVKSVIANGGLSVIGSASVSLGKIVTAGGGISIGGSALFGRVSKLLGNGSFGVAGSADFSRAKAIYISGGVSVGGSAGISKSFFLNASGGLQVGSSALVKKTNCVFSIGGAFLGGSASFGEKLDIVFVSSGGFSVGGSATTTSTSLNSAVTRLDRPSQVFDAIVSTLASAIANGNQKNIKICDYEEWGPAQHADRQILIEFGDLESDVGQNDGRHGQWQEIIIYPVISVAVPRAAREANNLASAIARKILGQRWGLPSRLIEAPERITARSAFFVKQKDVFSYEAWEVRFWQLIKYGDDQWPGDEGDEPFFALAINPSNPDDPGEYQDVWATS